MTIAAMDGGFSFTSDQLRDIIFFDDAVELLTEHGAVSEGERHELTGFGLLPAERKADLVGQPFLILEYRVREGLNNSTFSELLIITTKDERYILRDSSRGIHEQLPTISGQRRDNGHHPFMNIYVRKGLGYREYPITDPKGVTKTVRTYYLAL